MNQAKYEAALLLNKLENQHKVITEGIDKAEAQLEHARKMQIMTAVMIVDQRRAIAALPD